jgi:hypothetical protein
VRKTTIPSAFNQHNEAPRFFSTTIATTKINVHIVSNGGRIAWIIFGNVVLDLSDEISSHIGGLENGHF